MLSHLKYPAVALVAALTFLSFLAWQNPSSDPELTGVVSSQQHVFLLASGCQPIDNPETDFLDALATDKTKVADVDTPRLLTPEDATPSDDFIVNALANGEVVILFNRELSPADYSALRDAATLAIVENRTPLYLIPADEWNHDGAFRLMTGSVLQECVTPSLELIELFVHISDSV